MIVRVIGASDRALAQLREIAPPGVDIVAEPVAEADWLLVATAGERLEASRSPGLAAFRVLECPEIASELDRATTDALRVTLVKMAGIGASRPLLSSLGVLLVRPFVPRSPGSTDAALVNPDQEDSRSSSSGVARPMPAGRRLDELLAASDRKRAERFAARAERFTDRRS